MKKHPIFDPLRRGSRARFREFIREKGLFGQRKTADELEEEEKEQERKARRKERRKALTGEEEIEGEDGETTAKLPYVKKFFLFFREHWGLMGYLLFLSLLEVALHAAMPWSSKFIVDDVLPAQNVTYLLHACGVLLVLGVFFFLVSLRYNLLIQTLIGHILTTTRRRLMRHLQQMPLKRLQDIKVGGVVSRLQSDTEHMAGLVQQVLLTPFRAILMLVWAMGSLMYMNWKVALICLGFCSAVLTLAYLFFSLMRPFQRSLRHELSHITGHVTETFGGIQVVRAFNRAFAATASYAVETHLLWRKELHGRGMGIILHQNIRLIHFFIYVSIWGVGGYFHLKGEMLIGELVAFTMFIHWLFMPVFMIMSSFSHMQRSVACAERIFDLFDEPAGMPDQVDAREAPSLRESIRFDDVTFDYPDGTQALDHVSFDIPKGQTTALVGPSGAGKSTVTNLVMRFYDVTAGRILLDGEDIRTFRLPSYRRLFSLVLQDVILFDGTIRDNIAFGRPDAPQEEIEKVARIAHCAEFINELEDGYESIIGERGVKLSGGQKQRIALARALLVDPNVLILDEATSSLDSESEGLIQDALETIFRERTTLVIAHRLSTIMDADNIIVFDHGRVVEQGTHTELLSREGRYFELYMKQMEKAERGKAWFDWNDANGDDADAS